MKKPTIVLLLFFVGTQWVQAETHHHHQRMELGFSLSAVHLDHDASWLGGVHLHLSHRLADHGFWGKIALGVGLETLIGGAPHHAVMAGITITPWKGLAFAASPGILFASEDGEWERHFVLHLEVMYGFEIWGIEMGPLLAIAFAGGERHYGIGLHFGYGL